MRSLKTLEVKKIDVEGGEITFILCKIDDYLIRGDKDNCCNFETGRRWILDEDGERIED